MRGFELETARALLREQLTRKWEEDHLDQVATTDRLVQQATQSAGGNRSVLIRTALVVRQLGGMGIGHAQLARHLGITVDEVRHHRDRPLVAPADVMPAIEARVLDALPETTEPEREIAAVDPQADHVARIDAKARLIEHEMGR
jgi:hypothetical protein